MVIPAGVPRKPGMTRQDLFKVRPLEHHPPRRLTPLRCRNEHLDSVLKFVLACVCRSTQASSRVLLRRAESIAQKLPSA